MVLIVFAGNFDEIYDVKNLRWHHEVIKKYGGALVVHGILGVRFRCSNSHDSSSYCYVQDEQIYFTDPLALHHIVLKDQQSFMEPESHMA